VQAFGWIFEQAPGTAFGSSRQADTWKGDTRGHKVGSADLGVGRSWGGPDRVGFHPGEYQVGPKVGMGVFTVSLASYLVAVGPWIHVLAPDWSRVCFFVSMPYHGHMGACVVARRHVAWCGSHRSHTISCAYLSHLNFKGGK
jgi:hypothetical protein